MDSVQPCPTVSDQDRATVPARARLQPARMVDGAALVLGEGLEELPTTRGGAAAVPDGEAPPLPLDGTGGGA